LDLGGASARESCPKGFDDLPRFNIQTRAPWMSVRLSLDEPSMRESGYMVYLRPGEVRRAGDP
jgi:hypothetical protein